MRGVFRDFLLLRLIALLALLVVAAAVFGIRSLSRGADVAGAAILGGGVVCAAALGLLVTRRSRGRPR